MVVVRWFFDWVAPIAVIAVGLAWILDWADLPGGKPEQATLVLRDPWWLSAPVSGILVLLGALRLRSSIRWTRRAV
jgi:hypothetical protein